MNSIRQKLIRIVLLVAVGALFLAPQISAVEITRQHGVLEKRFGVGSWSYDTGWQGVCLGICGYGRAALKLGGDFLIVRENGEVKLETGASELWFRGYPDGGSLCQNFGVEAGAKVKICIPGIGCYEWPLPYIGWRDWLLSGCKDFTPYSLNQTQTLQTYLPRFDLACIEVGIPWVLSGNVCLAADAGVRQNLKGLSIQTSQGSFTSNGQRKDVNLDCSSQSFSVTSIRKQWNWDGSATASLYVVIGVTVIGIDYDIPITIIKDFEIPIDGIIPSSFVTTPARSVSFSFPCEQLSLQGDGCGQVRVDGSTKNLPWSKWYPRHTDVSLQALPCNCWNFDKWTGHLSGSSPSVTVDMDSDKYVTARFEQRTVRICGYVRKGNGAGIGGVVMNGLPGNPATSSDGRYCVTLPCGWSGRVTPTHSCYTFSPAYKDYSIVTTDRNDNYTGNPKSFTISGYVRNGNGSGIGGVAMSGLPGNPTTNSSGYYSATVSCGWSGRVAPTRSCYTFSPSHRDYSNVISNKSDNYTGTEKTYTISGYVRRGNGSGIGGVVMNGLPGNPTTSSNGSYSASVSCGWSGRVTPTHSCFTFNPAYRDYSSVTSNKSDNYTGTEKTYTISGYVRKGNDSGIGGVVMSGLPGNTTTSSNGSYSASVSCGWSGRVTPTHGCYSFNQPHKDYSNVTSNETNQNFAGIEADIGAANPLVTTLISKFRVEWAKVSAASEYRIEIDAPISAGDFTHTTSDTSVLYELPVDGDSLPVAGQYRVGLTCINECGASEETTTEIELFAVEGCVADYAPDTTMSDVWVYIQQTSGSGLGESEVHSEKTNGDGMYRFAVGKGDYEVWRDRTNGDLYEVAVSNGPVRGLNFNVLLDAEDSNFAVLPNEFRLEQNYPNPFNPETQIGFSLPRSAHVQLCVYNILGELVYTLVDDYLPAGYQIVSWHGDDAAGRPAPSGVYFYRIEAGEFAETRKMLLLK